ncbi:MAG: hypothetical protein WC584_00580 [Candidatus Pacearchaeota archaeon]
MKTIELIVPMMSSSIPDQVLNITIDDKECDIPDKSKVILAGNSSNLFYAIAQLNDKEYLISSLGVKKR